jgi:acyl-CoA thioester hydrolase
MPRVAIDLPAHFGFKTEIPLYLSHINFAGHLDNAQLLTIVSEARERLLQSFGYSSMNIEGLVIMLADAAVQYRSEAHHGDVLVVEMTANDFSKRGCDFVYRITDRHTGREVARGKSGVVFYDRQARQVAEVPAAFRARWPA